MPFDGVIPNFKELPANALPASRSSFRQGCACAASCRPRRSNFHHGKHHKAYVTKTNELIEAIGDLRGRRCSQVVESAKQFRQQQAVQQQRAAVESQLLLAMPSAGRGPAARRQARAADRRRLSATPQALLDKLQEEAVNHFANGWAWLVLDRGASA